MRPCCFILLLLCISASVDAQPLHPPADDKKAPRFQFLDGETLNAGTVAEGISVPFVFRFKNVGKQPLIITNAAASTGAMSCEWPSAPIPPGGTGVIRTALNTTGHGHQPFYKTIYVRSNATSGKDRIALYVKGMVAPAALPAAVPPTTAGALFQFPDGEMHDFGAVPEGPVVTYEYVFKNAGNAPLIITSLSVGDGSTSCEWPKEPVLPGRKGVIKVQFCTRGRGTGPFQRTIYIRSNVPPQDKQYELHFKGSTQAAAEHLPPGNG